MPVQDMGEIDAGLAAKSIYDSAWSGEAGNDGFGTTVELPSEEDLMAGSRAATRRTIIKTLAFFVGCLCVGAGAAFVVTREAAKFEPQPGRPPPPPHPMACMAFQTPGNASAMCSRSCSMCLNASDTGRNCPVGCTCTATCTTQGLVAATNQHGIPGAYMQSCSPHFAAGQ